VIPYSIREETFEQKIEVKEELTVAEIKTAPCTEIKINPMNDEIIQRVFETIPVIDLEGSEIKAPEKSAHEEPAAAERASEPNLDSQIKTVKLKLNERLRTHFKSIISEKLFQKNFSETGSVKEFEIRMSFQNLNQALETSDFEYTVNPISKTELSKFSSFSVSTEKDANLIVFVKVSMALAIFAFVYYKFLKNNIESDQNKLLLSVGVPTMVMFACVIAYLMYIRSRACKAKAFLGKLKNYINAGNVVSKDDVSNFACEEMKLDRVEFISSKEFTVMQEELSKDQGIEEFIDHGKGGILSWKKRE